MKQKIQRGLLLCWLAWAIPASAETRTTLQAELSEWSGSRQLQVSEEAATAFAAHLGLRWEKAAWRARLDGAFYGDTASHNTDSKAREAWVGWQSDSRDIRLGWQIAAWGRADGWNPTDVLTPWQRTRLVTDDNDQRTGRLGLRWRQDMGAYTVTALVFNDDRYDKLPIPAVGGLAFVDEKKHRPAAAFRLDRSGDGLDWGLAGYHGADLTPAFDVGALALGRVLLVHPDMTLVGGDFAAALGPVGLRGEAACLDTSDTAGRNPYTRNRQCQLIVGGDHDFESAGNLSLQAFTQHVRDWHDPAQAGPLAALYSGVVGQGKRDETGLILRWAQGFLNDALQLEIPVASTGHGRNVMARPHLRWSVNDRLTLVAGGDWFSGETLSLLGRLEENSVAFVAVRVGL